MLENLSTEKRNDKTMTLDQLTSLEVLQIMNEEDKSVPAAIEKQLSQIDKLVTATIHALKNNGRIIYLGAGTSGRLGVLDAAECPPTFGTPPGLVIGLIAGGEKAFTAAVEGAEDSMELAASDLQSINLTTSDVVIGIAASGRTPYVIGGLKYAKEKGGITGSISCNTNSEISRLSQIPIEIDTGSEILTGSTRLKAGTAQKLVLNMISTASMIGIGKVYKNLMVDVQPTNKKLVERSKRIIMEAAEVDYEKASELYNQAGGHVKKAIVMVLADCNAEEAGRRLEASEGFVRKAI
ncbi:N-acetylmuramic acid 6-phosphate etherase [Peribacillus sp. SCS-26]|uniref:N-acetylmuramic acid 6-phosphate etherase n=1 Tax=Paraperibacillus marinus TaxID=3115295 RepID=UPI0039058AAC